MADLITRSMWGARAPSGSYGTVSSTLGVKVHYTGGHVNPGLVGDHDLCVAAVKGIQNGHMDGNGWMDIGYTACVCPHRKVFVGRGPHRLCAANGPGLNSAHYAVLGLVGTSGLVTPPDGMLHGIRDAIDWLRVSGDAGNQIKGHRDGYATSCPGAALYAWVQAGAPRPGVTTPEPPIIDVPEEEVMEYASLGLETPSTVAIPPNTWFDVPFDTEYADPGNSHIDTGSAPSILKGFPSLYTGEFAVTFTGLAAGALVQMRMVEFLYNGTLTPPVDELKEQGDPENTVLAADQTAHLAATGSVQENRKLRVQVRHFDTTAVVKVSRARARMLIQR